MTRQCGERWILKKNFFKREKSGYTDILSILLLNEIMYVFPACHKNFFISGRVFVLNGFLTVFKFYLNFLILSNKIIKNRMACLNGLQIVMLNFWILEKSTRFLFEDFSYTYFILTVLILLACLLQCRQ